MKALKGLFAVFALLFVGTAYAATSAVVINLLSPTIACVVLAMVTMSVSNLRLLYEEKELGDDVCVILAFFLAAAALYSLPTTIFARADFVVILASLVIATIAAFFACAAVYSSKWDRKVYVVSIIVFWCAMCKVFAVLWFFCS